MMASRDPSNTHSGKVCNTCGVNGFEELLVSCIKCCTSFQHVYCSLNPMKPVHIEWTCEECEHGNDVVSLTFEEMIHEKTAISAGYGKVSDNLMRQGLFKRQRTVETAKVKFLPTEEAIMLGAKGMAPSPQCNMDSRFGPLRHRKSTKRVPTGFTSASREFPLMKLKENHGGQPYRLSTHPQQVSGKRSFVSPGKEYVRREESIIDVRSHARKVETSNTRAEKATKTSNTRAEKATNEVPSFLLVEAKGVKCHSDAEHMNSDKEMIPPIIAPKMNIVLKCAAIDAVWKGDFKFVDAFTQKQVYVGFRAHPPHVVHRKAYELSQQLPRVLQFKKLPRSSVWADLFQDDSPDGDDIALYFFPGKFGRAKQDYVHVLELLEKQDLAMRSHIGGIELLLFTSKRMHRDFQRIGMQYYLWGVFRCVKTKETMIEDDMTIPLAVFPSEHPGGDQSNKDNSDVVDMEIDMIGGKNVGQADKVVGKVKIEQCNLFPGFTVKVENRFASAEHLRRPCTDASAPPGIKEVCGLKVQAAHTLSLPKKEDTSTERFPVGYIGSNSMQFHTGFWKPYEVSSLHLPAHPWDSNPLQVSEMAKNMAPQVKKEK